jgi:hypothetical protein
LYIAFKHDISVNVTVAALRVRNLADWKVALAKKNLEIYCSEELQVSDKVGPATRDL